MNAPLKNVVPAMRQLNVSNHLIGDQKGLQDAWERDGYWFFRDVLDQDAVGALRNEMINYLDELGFVDRNDPEFRFKGESQENFPHRLDVMNERKACRLITEDPKVLAFFEKLFGVPACWVPFTVYRATPPAIDGNAPYFDMIHSDGIYNEGLDFLICWIPLADIPAETGGLAIAEGYHKLPYLNERSADGLTISPVPPERIPQNKWLRADYRAGDVLLMSLRTVHTGLANYSDRYRLSIDTRIMPSSGNVPAIGTITAISEDRLTLRTDKGGEITLLLDGQSYCRDLKGQRLAPHLVHTEYKVGRDVIISVADGRVKMMRPQR